MSSSSSARYLVLCLDDRIFSPHYETITPMQVLSGVLRQDLLRKRESENSVQMVTEVDIFFELYMTVKQKHRAFFHSLHRV